MSIFSFVRGRNQGTGHQCWQHWHDRRSLTIQQHRPMCRRLRAWRECTEQLDQRTRRYSISIRYEHGRTSRAGIVAYAIAGNKTLAGSPGLMKEWVRMTALSQIVSGKVVQGDQMLLANNGIPEVDEGIYQGSMASD